MEKRCWFCRGKTANRFLLGFVEDATEEKWGAERRGAPRPQGDTRSGATWSSRRHGPGRAVLILDRNGTVSALSEQLCHRDLGRVTSEGGRSPSGGGGTRSSPCGRSASVGYVTAHVPSPWLNSWLSEPRIWRPFRVRRSYGSARTSCSHRSSILRSGCGVPPVRSSCVHERIRGDDRAGSGCRSCARRCPRDPRAILAGCARQRCGIVRSSRVACGD